MSDSKVFETLKYQVIDDKIVHVQFNRARKLNSMNNQYLFLLCKMSGLTIYRVFTDLIEFFSKFVYTLGDIRAIVISGEGKHFTAGLDCIAFL